VVEAEDVMKGFLQELGYEWFGSWWLGFWFLTRIYWNKSKLW
jgi:hypothetical protein